MRYDHSAIPDIAVPRARVSLLQHALDTYASETNKVVSTWLTFSAEDLAWRPHPRSSTVEEIMRHQLLSERRFFAEFLGSAEPAPREVPPPDATPQHYARRMAGLALPRLAFLAAQDEAWWAGMTKFFDVERQRVWVFWRRVLHTAHHRAQLGVYLRLIGKGVPSNYGPTADVTWEGADPTLNVDAGGRQ